MEKRLYPARREEVAECKYDLIAYLELSDESNIIRQFAISIHFDIYQVFLQIFYI